MTLTLLSLLVLPSAPVYSQSRSELDKKTASVYLATDFEFAAHRSDAVNATDFGNEYGVTLGTWTGKNKTLGLAFSQRTNITRFTQVDAAMSSAWTDFILSYRILWFQPTLTYGTCEIKSKQGGVEKMDALCSSAGGGLDVHIPAGSFVVVDFSTKVSQPLSVRDKISNDNDVGSRQDSFLGVSLYPSFGWISFSTGYRYRLYNLTVDKEAHKEIETGPFLGFKLRYDL